MSNLFKSNYVVKKDETRVIDSNNLVASRLQMLSEILEQEPVREEEFVEGFTSGLNAEQLELLFEDNPEGEEAEYTDSQVDSEEMQMMLEEANSRAEEILEEARKQAEEIVARANEESGAIRQEAVATGHAEGYEAGHAEAMQIVDEQVKILEEKEASLLNEYDKRLEDMEPLLVDAITGVYEHVFHVALTANREIVLNLLHDTVRNIEGGKNFIVHVSKNDFEFINARKEQLLEGLGSTDTVEVIEDLTLYQSECFVEAEGGIYDCGIGTELELLKKELMLLAYRKV